MKALLATKLGMTQLFDSKGRIQAVTILSVQPSIVLQHKTVETDGYNAIQIGYGINKKSKKAITGHLKKAKANSRHITEVRIDDPAEISPVGEKIGVDSFNIGDIVSVSATSKGKGFAGTIKRHNFARGPKTHGSHNYRAPGSIGAGYPQHVFKGQNMAGQMGNTKVTTKNLRIVMVDTKNEIIAIKGAVPGPKKGIVKITLISTPVKEEAA